MPLANGSKNVNESPTLLTSKEKTELNSSSKESDSHTKALLDAAYIQTQGMETAATKASEAYETAMSKAAERQTQGLVKAAHTTSDTYRKSMSEVASKLSKAYEKAANKQANAILTAAGKNVVGLKAQIGQFIKDYAIPICAVIVSIAALGAAEFSTRQQVDATLKAANMQNEATLKAAREQIAATLDAAGNPLYQHVETVIELRSGKALGSTTRANTLLKSSSFTTLRSLQEQEKGNFLRFLAEEGLIKAKQPEIALSGADLRNINLKDAWLPDINLEGSYLLSGNLHHVDLTRANLRRSILEGTNFEGAVLVEADFTNAVLKDANLTNADLTKANLTNADFTGANLEGASIDINKAAQQGSTFCNAVLPNGKRYRCS